MSDQHNHPNVHQPWSVWSSDQRLHVVSFYSNPFRWKSRRELFNTFSLAMRRTPNVVLHVVEMAYGDRPFEVTGNDPNDIQLRTSHEMWHKENAINVAISRLPADWKYAAYVDGDFTFTRHDWALEAIHKLQHSPFVQLFSSYADLSHDHLPLQVRPSFAYAYIHYPDKPTVSLDPVSDSSFDWLSTYDGAMGVNGKGACPARTRNTTPGATGGAWSFTRQGFDAVGGLLDTCILGASDWYIAFGLVGETTDGHPEALSCGPAYEQSIRRWQDRAFEVVRGNINYVNVHCVHHWHGPKSLRGYGWRWKILRDNNFDPLVDVKRDWQGVYQWAGNKAHLEAGVRRYFLSRNEDDITCNERAMI